MPLTPQPEPDPDDVTVRFLHPFQATKHYRCPGCGHGIEPGLGHYVVVPVDAPDLRRHWHRSCWEQRARRRPVG